MSVYGNKIRNDKSISESCDNIVSLCIEMKSVNEFANNILIESYNGDIVLNEFNLSVIRKKLSKNDSIFKKIKREIKEIKLILSTKENDFLTLEHKKKDGVITIGPLYNYNDPLEKITELYKESIIKLKSFEKQIIELLSEPEIDVNKIKRIDRKMMANNVTAIDYDPNPRKIGRQKIELILPANGTNYDLAVNYDLNSILKKLTVDINPIIQNTLKEVENIVTILSRMNDYVSKYCDKIKRSRDKKLKTNLNILSQTIKDWYNYMSKCADSVEYCKVAAEQRDRLIKAFKNNK